MSELALLHAVTAFDLTLLGTLLLALPRVTRRGLLFGAFVGSEADAGREAERLRRLWTRGMLGLLSAAAAWAVLMGLRSRPIAGLSGSLGLVLVGASLLYLRLHRAARELVPAGAAARSPAPAPPESLLPDSLVVPLAVLAACLMLGTGSLVEAASKWPALPPRIPVHFGASGAPDAWGSKGFASVFVLPLANLLLGLMISGFGALIARSPLSLRGGRSVAEREAQLGFRRATVNMLCGTALACSGMLALLSHDALAVGLGERSALGPGVWIGAAALLLWVVGYLGRLLWHHGQGGSRREGEAASGPLTDGLADDRHWKWGLFYVNPSDRAILVEKRFGVGYTVNFGNRWGLALMLGLLLFFGLIGVLSLAAASG